MRTDDFRQFDYENKRQNKLIYGSSFPPIYNLSQVTVPINLYYSSGDTTAMLENVLKLRSQLPNVKRSYLVPLSNFEHVDFIYSRFVRKSLNEMIISTMEMANKN